MWWVIIIVDNHSRGLLDMTFLANFFQMISNSFHWMCCQVNLLLRYLIRRDHNQLIWLVLICFDPWCHWWHRQWCHRLLALDWLPPCLESWHHLWWLHEFFADSPLCLCWWHHWWHHIYDIRRTPNVWRITYAWRMTYVWCTTYPLDVWGTPVIWHTTYHCCLTYNVPFGTFNVKGSMVSIYCYSCIINRSFFLPIRYHEQVP